jgi:predicted deacylase
MSDKSTNAIEKNFLDVLELPDGSIVKLPVMTLKGSHPGPKLALIGAAHGWEVTGTEVIFRVMRESVNQSELHGSIVSIPVANPVGFQRAVYVPPQDNADVESAFPGDASGTATGRLSSMIWPVIEGAECFINLHCMEGPSIPYTIVRGFEANPSVAERSNELAKVFGFIRTKFSSRATSLRPKSSTIFAISKGVPAFVPEFPFSMIFTEEEAVASGVRGVLNVMKALGMISGQLEQQRKYVDLKDPIFTEMIFANRGGLLFPMKKPGDLVEKDDPLLKIVNIFGEEVERVLSPRKGVLMSYPISHAGTPINQTVTTGDPVADVGFEE